MAIRSDLFKKVQAVTNKGLHIMEGRQPGDITEILDEIVFVDGFEFGQSKDGEYVAFTIKDNDTEFFFGGSVVTEAFKALENALSEEEIIELLSTDFKVKFLRVKSENKRNYTKCIFFPNN